MASLLTDAQKLEISAAIEDVHDTFKEDIIIFLKSPEVLSGSTYNGYYNRAANISKSQTSTDLTPYTRQARVKYLRQDDIDANMGAQVGLESNRGDVRLKINEETANLIKQSVYVSINGLLFENPDDMEPVGIFSTHYYTIYMKRKV